MNRILSIIISIVFVIAVAGFIIFLRPNVPREGVPASTATASQTVFQNTVHGYSLSYPSDLGILEYTDDIAAIGHFIEGGIDSVADIRTIVVEGTEGQSFSDAAIEDLATLCDADGPDASFSCTGVERINAFMSSHNVVGFEVYLKGEQKTLSTGTVTATEKGPYYAFAIATSGTATKVLIIHAPLNKTSAEADAATIKAIASSLRVGS